jgi:hypothetical protein
VYEKNKLLDRVHFFDDSVSYFVLHLWSVPIYFDVFFIVFVKRSSRFRPITLAAGFWSKRAEPDVKLSFIKWFPGWSVVSSWYDTGVFPFYRLRRYPVPVLHLCGELHTNVSGPHMSLIRRPPLHIGGEVLLGTITEWTRFFTIPTLYWILS